MSRKRIQMQQRPEKPSYEELERRLALAEAALSADVKTIVPAIQQNQSQIEQAYQQGVNYHRAAVNKYFSASNTLMRFASYIEGAATSGNTADTRETIARHKADMMKQLDLFRTCVSDIRTQYGFHIPFEVIQPGINYIHGLYNRATRYVEAREDMQIQRQQELRAFIESDDNSGEISSLLYAIDTRQEPQPYEETIVRFHRAHYKQEVNGRKLKFQRDVIKHFIHITNGNHELTDGEQIALNILLPLTERERIGVWGDIVRRYKNKKLPEKSGNF